MRDKANESVATAIAQHLNEAAALMASQRGSPVGGSLNEAEIIARLDLILAKLDRPAVPLSEQLWDTKLIALYLKRSPDNVRKEIVCLPSFPRPIRLPVNGKAQALYKAREVIRWAESFQEKRLK
jgi:hypothetical protein